MAIHRHVGGRSLAILTVGNEGPIPWALIWADCVAEPDNDMALVATARGQVEGAPAGTACRGAPRGAAALLSGKPAEKLQCVLQQHAAIGEVDHQGARGLLGRAHAGRLRGARAGVAGGPAVLGQQRPDGHGRAVEQALPCLRGQGARARSARILGALDRQRQLVVDVKTVGQHGCGQGHFQELQAELPGLRGQGRERPGGAELPRRCAAEVHGQGR
mmetsp:Transcript_87293/g.282637  ORF Transcript_87293/g.282637 Transcript_87293/m.282637 type:complete len:217 (+) Transcript_87293:546-1196(+)